MKRLIKLLATLLLVMVAAVVIIPLVVLAGLFIWLKLTEEIDEEALELEELGEDEAPA
jgi:cytochrome bd-type quinol oxidase subunit 2